jgi:hypothetical protein
MRNIIDNENRGLDELDESGLETVEESMYWRSRPYIGPI